MLTSPGQIELIQYDRRIGKKVYCSVLVAYERWLHMAVLLLRPLDKIAQWSTINLSWLSGTFRVRGFPLSVSSAFTEASRGKLEKAFWTERDRERLSEGFRRKIDHVLKMNQKFYILARVKGE